MNFSSYLNQQRVYKAIEYLREGRWGVSQVSEMVGYHEFSYFCKVFKKYTGKTPSEYVMPNGQTGLHAENEMACRDACVDETHKE